MTEQTHELVPVNLGDRSYEIEIGQGLIGDAGTRIAPVLASDRVFVIFDEALEGAHLDALQASLSSSELQVETLKIPRGEASKSWQQFQHGTEWLLEHRVTRKDAVIAFGGGVVGDLAGFIAASTLRGINFIQIPTTLLSQVDSSVGGKTAINTRFGKNLVGAFYQPKKVIIDTEVLNSLPHRELLSGYAETAKYGCIDEPEFFAWLEENIDDVLARKPEALAFAIATSCRAKARIVSEDETESNGKRSLLNLGHTFAHALEAEAGYDGSLLHGEAVAIGICVAFDLSQRLGLCDQQAFERARTHFQHANLGTDFAPLRNIPMTVERLIDHMSRDKKVEAGNIRFVLTKGIGEAFLSNGVDPSAVTAVLTDYLDG